MGPTFCCCRKMAVTRRRSKLWWRKAHQSKTLVELQRSRRSKQDLKPSGDHFLFEKFGPCGHIKGALLQKKISISKNVKNQFWPVLKYVKKYAKFNGAIRFAWTLLKSHVFDDFHFWCFLFIILHFYIFTNLVLSPKCSVRFVNPFYSLAGSAAFVAFDTRR